MRTLLLTMLLAAFATVAAAQDRWEIADPMLIRLAAEAHAACPQRERPRSTHLWELLGDARDHSGLSQRWNCAAQPALGLRIARGIAERPNAASAEGHRLLAELYTRGIAVPADAAAAARHLRVAWLLAEPRPETPFATEAQADAYLVRPATIALLRRYAASPGLPYARFQLARALVLRDRGGDVAAALDLLDHPDVRTFPQARWFFARTALASSREPARRARAMSDLRSLALFSDPGSEARTLLTGIARRQLASSRPQEERWDAIESLAALAFRGEPQAVAELLRAVSAANGGLPPTTVAGPVPDSISQPLRVRISDDDYPASALRGEVEGRVALRGLIDPRGRLIYTDPLAPGQPAVLLNAVRVLYARRGTRPVDLGALRTAPYMWIELPGVYFVLAE